MSYPARGPVRSMGIDGQAIAFGGRRAVFRASHAAFKEAEGMSYPARGPEESEA